MSCYSGNQWQGISDSDDVDNMRKIASFWPFMYESPYSYIPYILDCTVFEDSLPVYICIYIYIYRFVSLCY